MGAVIDPHTIHDWAYWELLGVHKFLAILSISRVAPAVERQRRAICFA